MLRERHASDLVVVVGVPDEVTVARVFVADLQLVFVLVGFHEEAFCDVEQHGQVAVRFRFFGRHPDMAERPCRWAELFLEIKQPVAARSSG